MMTSITRTPNTKANMLLVAKATARAPLGSSSCRLSVLFVVPFAPWPGQRKHVSAFHFGWKPGAQTAHRGPLRGRNMSH
eukprot:5839683-Prymnesium_polylepis.2